MSSVGMKITNFHYAHMKLPDGPTGFVEFPKWVYPIPDSTKSGVLVQNAEEEAAYYDALAKNEPAPASKPPAEASAPEPTIILSGANDERELLMQIAKEKNIKVDARWRTERLRATIERETAHMDAQ